MVTTKHSVDSRVYLDDADISGSSSSIELPEERVLNDKTTFGNSGRKYQDGPTEDKISWEGLFENASSDDQADEELQALLGSEVVGTFWPAGDAVGEIGRGSPTCMGRNYRISTRIPEMVLATAEIESNATLERLIALQTKDATAISATENGSSVDNSASSSNGVAWYYHVFTLTASGGNAKWVLHLQDSANDSTWADVDTVDVTGQTSGRRTASGTIDRYVRQRRVLDASSGTIISHISHKRT